MFCKLCYKVSLLQCILFLILRKSKQYKVRPSRKKATKFSTIDLNRVFSKLEVNFLSRQSIR